MSYEIIVSSSVRAHVLIDNGTNHGGVAVLFEMHAAPVVLNGEPSPEQLEEIARINTHIFN